MPSALSTSRRPAISTSRRPPLSAPRRTKLSPVGLLLCYLELARVRIVGMVLVACAIGFVLASAGHVAWGRAVWTFAGTAVCAAGACAINGYAEREADGLMERTRGRPLPTGTISPGHALAFGMAFVLGGCAVLAWRTNLLAASLGLLSVSLYLFVYTPLKRVTWLATSVGALPGAIPPLIGWAAATGRLGLAAWILFAMLFLWQHVHFWTIAWVFRDDYRRAGFRMLPAGSANSSGSAQMPTNPVTDAGGAFRLTVFAAAALLPVSLLLVALGLAGPAYGTTALLVGIGLLVAGVRLSLRRSLCDARLLLLACGCYLPLLLGAILLDACWLRPV